MPSFRPALRTALVAVLLGLLCAASARAQGYPHVGLYWSVHRDGRPLLDAGGNVDPVIADAVARYQLVIVDVDPFSPYRPDAIQALRQRNPNLKVLGYVTGHYIWPSLDPDSLNHFPTRYWRTVRDLDGFLYNTNGQLFGMTNSAFMDVNMAKKDLTGRYVVAEAVAQLFHDAVLATGTWDGVFIDTYCEHCLWAQAPGESVDFVRAGYSTPAAFDAGWKAGTDALAAKLRQLAGPTPILVGNCEPSTKYAWFNGWMRENFPFQGGGTWYANMYDDPGGYLIEEQRFQTPRHNFIFSGASPPTAPYYAENLRRARYGLGSAALGDGIATFGYSGRVTDQYPYWTWWYDEYAVDANGNSTTSGQDTGWLGQPLGPYYQMIWAGSNPDASANPDVETNLSGWTFWYNLAEVTSTFTRDTTTAAVGRASMKVTVPNATSVDWYVNIATGGSIPALANFTYSATFWAKASRPRNITVIASNTGASRVVAIGTTWKQYQAALVPLWNGTANLAFFLGADVGDVWIDDAHLQRGATSIFRRDFQNGVVLVNPSDTPLDVPLGATYRRIHGIQDPATNDGASISQLQVPAFDARFLIGSPPDLLPPAAILNLRFGP